MIAKIKQGSDFGGAISYALNRDEAYILATRCVRQGNNETMAESFDIQAMMNPIKKPVAHISLNFSAEDKPRLSDEKMVEVAIEYIKLMGYANTQFIIVRHTDRQHPHCHLILNRVDFDGKRISDKNEKIRNTKACRELTERYGFHISEGKKAVKRDRLREPEKTKYEINDSLEKHIPSSKSWHDLISKLERDGISVAFKMKGSTDEVQGIKFTKNGRSFSGSKIDKQFSYSKINYSLIQNERAEQQQQQ